MWRIDGRFTQAPIQAPQIEYGLSMRVPIRFKLFVVISSVLAVMLLVTLLLVRASFVRQFHQFVADLERTRISRIAAVLGQEFERTGDFEFLARSQRAWRRFLSDRGPHRLPPHVGDHRPGFPPKPPAHFRPPPGASGEQKGLFPGRIAVIATDGTLHFGDLGVIEQPDLVEVPILAHGEPVGKVVAIPSDRLDAVLDQIFLSRHRDTLFLIALLVLAGSAIASLLLARQLTLPIKRLRSAISAIATGNYQHRASVTSNDELADLAADVNTLAATLDANVHRERRWFADISHELRTPVAIMRGEIDAVRDGLRSFNTETVDSLREEVNRLSELIDDLHQLSVSELGPVHYDEKPIDLRELLAADVARFRTRAGEERLDIDFTCPDDSAYVVVGDASRLSQLFRNLIENSLRYTNEGGAIRIELTASTADVIIVVDDSEPGVPTESLSQVFERLYRVDESRARASGGSGLGLTICKNIVEAHKGSIEASHSDLGGLRIRVRLPRSN